MDDQATNPTPPPISKPILSQPVPNPVASNPNIHTHKVFASVGLILIGTIIAVAGIWWYVQNQGGFDTDKAGTATTKVSTSSANKATTSAERIETSGWKLYRNSAIGFEVKYPKEWSSSDIVEDVNSVMLLNQEGANLDAIAVSFDFSNSAGIISSYNKIKAYKVSEAVKDWNGYSQNLTRLSDKNFEGNSTISYQISPHYTEGGFGNAANYGIYFLKGGKIYQFEVYYGQDAINPTQTFDLILSTFKFL